MKRYDQFIPEGFKLGEEIGILLAAQISEAIERGTMHFKCLSYEYLPSVKEVMIEIDKNMSLISWQKEMNDVVGLHDFNSGKNILIPTPSELKYILKGDKDED